MARYDDDFPSKREVASYGIGYGVTIIFVVFVLGLFAWGVSTLGWFVTKPIDTAKGVVDRVINPDHALASYRWFHEANNQIAAKKGQIALSKAALEASAPDRKEARRVELLGLQQGCQNLVGEYNALATRADTVIFMHPEKFLPGDWPGDRSPLPPNVDATVCL